MTKYRTIVVDDHRVFQEYLCAVLAKLSYIDLKAKVSNGLELLNYISWEKADIVFMEINCSAINCHVIIKKILSKFPDTKIIATSLFEEDEKNHYSKLMNSGVHGFILKHSSRKEVEKVVNKVMSGEKYFSVNSKNSFVFSQT